MESIRNVSLKFTPEFEVSEGKAEGWLKIGGVALTEGVSRNKNVYSVQNLKENDGRQFKWLVGHSKNPEIDVVGKGKLAFEGDKLFHEGTIRNTANHPDIVEKVRDGFLGPSIHATAERISRKEGKYFVEGLSIDGVSLVAFQGVKNATIDYAIAESFDLNEQTESDEDEQDKDKEAGKMPEDETVEDTPEETPEPVEEPAKEEAEEPKAEESAKRIEALEEEISKLKESRKESIVENILKVNPELKKEDLMKESEEKLGIVYEYEQKLASRTEEAAIVEEDTVEKKELVVEKNGEVKLSEQAWKDFNRELRERV